MINRLVAISIDTRRIMKSKKHCKIKYNIRFLENLRFLITNNIILY